MKNILKIQIVRVKRDFSEYVVKFIYFLFEEYQVFKFSDLIKIIKLVSVVLQQVVEVSDIKRFCYRK